MSDPRAAWMEDDRSIVQVPRVVVFHKKKTNACSIADGFIQWVVDMSTNIWVLWSIGGPRL